MATLLMCGSLALAQVCPPTAAGTVCLVPPRTAATTTITSTSAACPTVTLPMSNVPMTYQMSSVPMYQPAYQVTTMPMGCQVPMASVPMQPMQFSMAPMASVPMQPMQFSMAPMAGCPMGASVMNTGMVPISSLMPSCPSSVSADTSCLLSAISGLRNDVRATNAQIYATSLTLRGQMLTSRINALMTQEMLFRQQLAANPNMPNAQAQAAALQAEAMSINRDIAAFNQELAMVPADQRPYLASSLNTFDVVYWQPTMQSFASYRNQFQQASATYQSAVAANPWLPAWQTQYQTSINNIATTPQVYASARWWTGTQVLGSTEMYPSGIMTAPSGSMMSLPAGATIYIPPSSMSTTTGTVGTTGTMVMPNTGTSTMTIPQTY